MSTIPRLLRVSALCGFYGLFSGCESETAAGPVVTAQVSERCTVSSQQQLIDHRATLQKKFSELAELYGADAIGSITATLSAEASSISEVVQVVTSEIQVIQNCIDDEAVPSELKVDLAGYYLTLSGLNDYLEGKQLRQEPLLKYDFEHIARLVAPE